MTRGPTEKIENNVKIACLKKETIGKLINRIPDSRLLISNLPGSALRTHVEWPGKHRDLKALPGKLDIKRHSPIETGALLSSQFDNGYPLFYYCF